MDGEGVDLCNLHQFWNVLHCHLGTGPEGRQRLMLGGWGAEEKSAIGIHRNATDWIWSSEFTAKGKVGHAQTVMKHMCMNYKIRAQMVRNVGR